MYWTQRCSGPAAVFRTIDTMYEFSNGNRREREIQRAVSVEDCSDELWNRLLLTFSGDDGAGVED